MGMCFTVGVSKVKRCCGHSLCTFSPRVLLCYLTLLKPFIRVDIRVVNGGIMSNFVLYEGRAQPVMFIQATILLARRCLNYPPLAARAGFS